MNINLLYNNRGATDAPRIISEIRQDVIFIFVLVKKKFLFLPKRVPGKRQMLTGQPELGKERKRKKKKCNKKKIFEIYKKIYDHQSTIAEAPEAVV